MNIRIRILHTTVKPVRLLSGETWRTTAKTEKDQGIHQHLPKRILQIQWPETISNRELWKQTKQQPQDKILQWHWRRIGQTLRKPMTLTTGQALTWNPQGKRRRGHPRKHLRPQCGGWKKEMGYTWGQLERLAQHWNVWRAPVGRLSSSRGPKSMMIICYPYGSAMSLIHTFIKYHRLLFLLYTHTHTESELKWTYCDSSANDLLLERKILALIWAIGMQASK